MLRLGWFSTGRDEAARELLTVVKNKIDSGEIPDAKIAYVFCNREKSESKESDLFLELVQRLKITPVAYSSKNFRERYRKECLADWRENYDLTVAQYLEMFFGKVDLIVLAGYMLVVSPPMCQRYNIINLHPALPGGPKGTWQEVIWQLIGEKARETGAMTHLVTPELDRGPAITFCRFPLWGVKFDDLWRWNDLFNGEHRQHLFEKIRGKELRREFPLIIETLKLLARGEIIVREGKVFDSRGNLLDKGFDLSEIVNTLAHK